MDKKALLELAGRCETLRDKVLAFAMEHKDGFTDEDLGTEFPGAPESSLRKRRSEISQDGWIIDTGRTTQNKHGSTVKIWRHRDMMDLPAVYAGSAASNPLDLPGLDENLRLQAKRKGRALAKFEAARDELEAADAAFEQALSERKAWDDRDAPKITHQA